jgi:hypothetical protein
LVLLLGVVCGRACRQSHRRDGCTNTFHQCFHSFFLPLFFSRFSRRKFGKFFSNPQNLRAIHSEVDCVKEPFAHGLTCGKRVRWSSWGRRPTDLARAPPCPLPTDNVNTIVANYQIQSPKTQLGVFFLVRCLKSTARRSSRHARLGDFLSMMEEAMSITAIAFVLINLLVRFRFDPQPTQSATHNFTAVHMML